MAGRGPVNEDSIQMAGGPLLEINSQIPIFETAGILLTV
jgi:hypothetical protein